MLQHTGGVHAVLTCTLWSRTVTRAWVAGTEGRIDIDPVWYAPTTLRLSRDDGAEETFDGVAEAGSGPGKGLRFEAAEVARCVREQRPESPLMPLDETVSIMQTMDAIRQRCEEGVRG